MGKPNDFDFGYRPQAVNIVGAKPAGLTKKVASRLEGQIKTAFQQSGEDVHVRGVRFIPSTRVDLGSGSFQVMANTVVERSSIGSALPARSFDSVFTVIHDPGKGQSLSGVKIPALLRSEP